MLKSTNVLLVIVHLCIYHVVFAAINPVYSQLNLLPKIYETTSYEYATGKSSIAIPKRFICRNVPGYGSCLFYALSSCITFDRCQAHLSFSQKKFQALVQNLRKMAVDTLRSDRDKIYLENNEIITSKELLSMVSNHSSLSEDDYCARMLNENTWGTGTEIVALSNHFERPIHVYELTTKRSFPFFGKIKYKFKLCAGFGSPSFDNKTPYYILCADGRFPNVSPNQVKFPGDHFYSLFPVNDDEYEELVNRKSDQVQKTIKTSLRGTTRLAGGGKKIDRKQSKLSYIIPSWLYKKRNINKDALVMKNYLEKHAMKLQTETEISPNVRSDFGYEGSEIRIMESSTKLHQLLEDFTSVEKEIAELELNIAEKSNLVEEKGREVERKLRIESAAQAELRTAYGDWVATLENVKRLEEEITFEKAQKDCAYLSLVATEEKALGIQSLLRSMERDFVRRRDEILSEHQSYRAACLSTLIPSYSGSNEAESTSPSLPLSNIL